MDPQNELVVKTLDKAKLLHLINKFEGKFYKIIELL